MSTSKVTADKPSTDNKGFEIQVCGADLVAVFESGLEIIEQPAKGKPVMTGKRANVFDENDLAVRIELLTKMKKPSNVEKQALGELRRSAFTMGISLKGVAPAKKAEAAAAESADKKGEKPKTNWMQDILKSIDQSRS